MKKTLIWLTLLTLAGGGGYWYYQQQNTTQTAQQYRTQKVEKGDLKQTVSANGTINPVALVNVGTQVSGTVKKLYVDYNSKVSKGQVLLELDDSLLRAQQQQSQANLASASASLELAQTNEKRMRGLFEKQYISQQELDNAVHARKVAEAQVQQAKAVVQKDQVNLAYTVIRSPVSGVVVDRSVDMGQTVAASLQTPTLFKIARDLSNMQIDAYFAEADIGNIRPDLPVRFTVDAFPNRSFKGNIKLIRINPTTTQNVVTYDVILNVDNSEQLLLPGMTAYVSITVAERHDVMLVPNAALRFKPADANKNPEAKRGERGKGENAAKRQRDGFTGRVYVMRNGTLTPVTVNLGITDSRNTEVVGGELQIGDQVVIGDNSTDKLKAETNRPVRMF